MHLLLALWQRYAHYEVPFSWICLVTNAVQGTVDVTALELFVRTLIALLVELAFFGYLHILYFVQGHNMTAQGVICQNLLLTCLLFYRLNTI